MIRKLLLGFVVVLVIGGLAYWRFHRSKKPIEIAYAGDREVTLWSTTAEVREPVATVGFGERLDVLEKFGDQEKVRTASGTIGWTSQDNLLSADFWQKAQELGAQTVKMTPQVSGHTHARANLHIDPARDSPRIRQLDRDVPVDLFERQIVDVPSTPSTTPATAQDDASPDAPKPEARKEDWWLVRARPQGQSGATAPALSGWLLGRFVDLDVPAPLPDYASSAGMRVVAWFELNRVADASGASKPQYLVVGTRGAEGQPCDFKLLRVFTWATKRQRYETAFVQSDLCGKLPVKVTPPPSSSGYATFAFEDWTAGTQETRTYRMYQNVVRRVREGKPEPATPSKAMKVAKRTKTAKRKHAHQ